MSISKSFFSIIYNLFFLLSFQFEKKSLQIQYLEKFVDHRGRTVGSFITFPATLLSQNSISEAA